MKNSQLERIRNDWFVWQSVRSSFSKFLNYYQISKHSPFPPFDSSLSLAVSANNTVVFLLGKMAKHVTEVSKGRKHIPDTSSP